jgi:hypothetical protein
MNQYPGLQIDTQSQNINIEIYELRDLKPETLQKRFDELGWKIQDLAEAVAEQRYLLYGERINAVSLRSGIQRALKNPNTATWKTLNCIIHAMDGNLTLKWRKTRLVTEEVEEEI